jgi:glyoxylase-like metal-dependent hydrolase (beta-lactamase superfamily II)
MRAHHLNCVSTSLPGGRLVDGGSASATTRSPLANHCLLVETDQGLVLVDSGLGLDDVRAPTERLGAAMLRLLRPALCEEMTARRQIERMGFDPADVRHIVLTHLDCDRAGGLDDFPNATVHLLAEERSHAEAQRSWLDRQRYRPQQWSSAPRWRTYAGGLGGDWFGFGCVQYMAGLPPEILLVPLPGHTPGHAGVAVHLDEGWKLLAGDAYCHHAELDPLAPRCPPGLSLYQRMMETARSQRLQNRARLHELHRDHARRVTLFCSQDPVEFERLAARPLNQPAEKPAPVDDFFEPLRRRA